MSQHPNARLTPRGRETLVSRVARQMGVSRQTASKWLARARRRGPVTQARYECERPGEPLHVDVKKVARIPDGGGHSAPSRGRGSPRSAGSAPARRRRRLLPRRLRGAPP